MRSLYDVVRSLIKHVSIALGPEWEIGLWAEDAFEAPFVRVGLVGDLERVEGDARMTTLQQRFSVYAYAKKADTPEASMVSAMELEDALFEAFAETRAGIVWPLRVPLWDYAGVPMGDNGTVRGEHDYIRITNVSVRSLPDDADDDRVVVVLDATAGWARSTELAHAEQGGAPVQSVRVRFAAEGTPQTIRPAGIKPKTTVGQPRTS